MKLRDTAIRDIGCICCMIAGHPGTPCEKHHLLTTGRHGTGKRRGEDYTVGLCTYHHRGRQGVGSKQAKAWAGIVGPSYADDAAEFREYFGDDAYLLEYQNERIREWQRLNV